MWRGYSRIKNLGRFTTRIFVSIFCPDNPWIDTQNKKIYGIFQKIYVASIGNGFDKDIHELLYLCKKFKFKRPDERFDFGLNIIQIS